MSVQMSVTACAVADTSVFLPSSMSVSRTMPIPSHSVNARFLAASSNLSSGASREGIYDDALSTMYQGQDGSMHAPFDAIVGDPISFRFQARDQDGVPIVSRFFSGFPREDSFKAVLSAHYEGDHGRECTEFVLNAELSITASEAFTSQRPPLFQPSGDPPTAFCKLQSSHSLAEIHLLSIEMAFSKCAEVANQNYLYHFFQRLTIL